MKKIILFISIIGLVGCSTLKPDPVFYEAQRDAIAATAKTAAQPLLHMTGGWHCTTEPCELSVYDPRAIEHIARVTQGKGPVDVMVKGLDAVGGVLKWGVAGYAASRAFREMGDQNVNIENSGDGSSTSWAQDTHTTTLISDDHSIVSAGDQRVGDEIAQDNVGNVAITDSGNDNSNHDNPVDTRTNYDNDNRTNFQPDYNPPDEPPLGDPDPSPEPEPGL